MVWPKDAAAGIHHLLLKFASAKILAADPPVRWCAVVAIVLFDMQFIAAAFRSTGRSQRIALQLDSLAHMPRAYYQDIALHSSLTIAFALMNSAICVAVVVLLFKF